MAKQKTHAALKKELDTIFSKYIRWYYADENGNVECYTCGIVKQVKQIQNGHFQSRRHTSTRWHLNNCRPQCVKCNMYSQGEQLLFYRRLCADIGEQNVDEVVRLSKSSIKYSKEDLKELIKHYKQLLKEICL